MPDEKKGERIVLLVDDSADAERVNASLAHSDLPALLKSAETVNVPEIPKLGSGKLDIKGAKQLAERRKAS